MAKEKLVRVIGPGIYGVATAENPTGEVPLGTEFSMSGDIPVGWQGRVAIVGAEPAEGAELIVNDDDDSDVGRARREVIAKAQEHIDGLKADHATAITALTARAETAETALATANEHIDGLKAQIVELLKGKEPSTDPATADEIKAAVDLLDAKNGEHWTKAGLPAVEVVAEITGKVVTREAIEAAAPDAKRPTE
ncbi:hypothetical protein [Sphingopyxis macrogoltabida]|uniref:Uncharacterized protein n=1 Tax=Sphingopyxis macrogoltabida TaxID=33050 RepID=A0AAC9FFL9_SPHMC|nr:hypothetical protein [Sphingopyxis macrogoltabida]ALJ12633.1 hypothetical protein LH19_07115 [Sphingopyxis macrogoltabida]AMU89898.1 hypothetical protein ATM17_12715 [Sphingopyxis macrogoltabida]